MPPAWRTNCADPRLVFFPSGSIGTPMGRVRLGLSPTAPPVACCGRIGDRAWLPAGRPCPHLEASRRPPGVSVRTGARPRPGTKPRPWHRRAHRGRAGGATTVGVRAVPLGQRNGHPRSPESPSAACRPRAGRQTAPRARRRPTSVAENRCPPAASTPPPGRSLRAPRERRPGRSIIRRPPRRPANTRPESRFAG